MQTRNKSETLVNGLPYAGMVANDTANIWDIWFRWLAERRNDVVLVPDPEPYRQGWHLVYCASALSAELGIRQGLPKNIVLSFIQTGFPKIKEFRNCTWDTAMQQRVLKTYFLHRAAWLRKHADHYRTMIVAYARPGVDRYIERMDRLADLLTRFAAERFPDVTPIDLSEHKALMISSIADLAA